jgi:ATP-dependent DNA helicase RecG
MYSASDQQIAALIVAGESYRCEFKRDLSGGVKEKIARTICAFANDISGSGAFGVIAIGVADDGSPSGSPITDQVELAIQDIRGDGKISPMPSFTTQKRNYRGQDILCIEVQPSASPPVKCDGKIWIRLGNSNRAATVEDERRLSDLRRAKEQPDDTQVLERFSIRDLNLNYFKEIYLPQAFAMDVIRANGRTTEEQLSSTKMIGYGYGEAKQMYPTVLGMLSLGLSPVDAVPGAYVQFVRFAGHDETTPVIDQQAIHGSIEDIIQSTEAKFQAHNRIPIDFTSQAKEVKSPEYPLAAFQQLFRNAVLHRAYLGNHSPIRVYWFEDRLAITNPGGPWGMSLEEFGVAGATAYRNPNLAGVLRDLEFVQRFGAGISTARASLKANGNPELELEPSANYVTVTMHHRPQHD